MWRDGVWLDLQGGNGITDNRDGFNVPAGRVMHGRTSADSTIFGPGPAARQLRVRGRGLPLLAVFTPYLPEGESVATQAAGNRPHHLFPALHGGRNVSAVLSVDADHPALELQAGTAGSCRGRRVRAASCGQTTSTRRSADTTAEPAQPTGRTAMPACGTLRRRAGSDCTTLRGHDRSLDFSANGIHISPRRRLGDRKPRRQCRASSSRCWLYLVEVA